ncbi:MAG TPA: DUF202 domain-containing protein [Kineosporiaceae bacterium]|nr:DUF202 domain-containing protein [Kineosporiaceae bacterium]
MARDPGLQAERTRLAWQRTGVAGTVVGSAAALSAAHRGDAGVLLIAVLACLVAGVATLAGSRLPPEEPYGRLVLGAAVTIAIAVAGVTLAIT